MTLTTTFRTTPATTEHGATTGHGATSDRFRLHRAGVLNVWQYDDQEFLLADGRMLLRGANGAGKSKTLEMLLPFALDGDKSRITASARHHTSLLWLMTDGYDGQARVGYVWVEFLRRGAEGGEAAFTCGVGIRASASARTATAWHFATDRRIGHDLFLEDDGGPLSRARLEEALGEHGQVFERAATYKEYVGRSLFGLDPAQYDEVLRLLYWLRQPQVGEDIEPARLASQLAQSLPQLDEQAVKAAGDTFDELTAYGEQIERRSAAAEALTGLAATYAGYARAVASARGRAVVDAVREERRLRGALRRAQRAADALRAERDRTQSDLDEARRGAEQDRARIAELEASPEARDQRRLADLAELEEQHDRVARHSADRVARDSDDLARRTTAHDQRAVEIVERLGACVRTVRDLDARQHDSGVGERLAVPAAVGGPVLDGPDRAADVDDGLARTGEALAQARSGVGRRQAAVRVVREALATLDEARRGQSDAERRADEAEHRWEDARGRRESAQADADREADELARALAAWAGHEAAPAVDLPAELTPDEVAALPELARGAAAPTLADLRARHQAAASVVDRAQVAIGELGERRTTIEHARDPEPPAPVLPRTPRPDGLPLWRLVDFADDLASADRAGLEAALQDSGLLDAWLRPDGRLLDHDSRDVVLVAEAALEGPTLADVLRPDVPDGSDGSERGDVSPGDVARVLRSVRLGDDPRAAAAAGVDGRWRLGPLHGRAGKPIAQYVGATARAQERSRRLEEIDQALTREHATRDEAVRTMRECADAVEALEGWVRLLPSADPLREAWTRADTLREAEQRDEVANARAQAEAHRARDEAARVRAEAERLSAAHAVPLDHGELDALHERLRQLDDDLGGAVRDLAPLRRDLGSWAADGRELVQQSDRLEADRRHADQAAEQAAATAAKLAELRASVGAGVRELEDRLKVLRESRSGHESTERGASTRLVELSESVGTAGQAVVSATEALAEHGAHRAESLTELAMLTTIPGLLDSASSGASSGSADGEHGPALADAGEVGPGDDVPSKVLSAAEGLASLARPGDDADPSGVWRSYSETASGPAADHEPSVVTYGDLLAVSGRDDAGECPVERLAARVGAAVARDRELLTERERQRFEQHVLGELGDAIRRCRLEAEELVTAMNDLLGGVTTSQGIRVRLDWRLRDDVPAEAREAVRLLGQPVGALLPEERTTLRDALHRLIEASRAERPELAYGEHLAAALDYRGWFAFRIRYTRPESAGSWLDLHRRSPLSQGEQKVLCYLPLFAAAAAHFTSLAGAAPYAPRLVLLDDAFPKIDVRTHPLLFGLLVQLDLDFVVTSERLWGDHETVPSLAIYEALRDPSQRGIAQYEYRWDGRQLRSIG